MKKTRKSMAEEFIAIMKNIEEPAKRLHAHPDFDQTKELVVAYTTIEKGQPKVHYHCRKCGTHTVVDGTYAYNTFTCPNCQADTVQNSRTSSYSRYNQRLYVEKTPGGFFAMEYVPYVVFPDVPEWYNQQPETNMRLNRVYLFDREVGILMGNTYPYPTVASNSAKTMQQIKSLLYTRSDGRGMSHEDWTASVMEVKDFLNKKEAAAQERAKTKQPTIDIYQNYKAQSLDKEKLYDRFKMFVATTYDKTATGTTVRIWCTSCGKYHDRPYVKTDKHVCPHCGFSVEEFNRMNGYSSTAWNRVSTSFVLVENTNLPDNDLLLRLIEVSYEVSREDDESDTTLKRTVNEKQRIFLGKKIRVYGNGTAGSIRMKSSVKSIEGHFNSRSNKYTIQDDAELVDIISKSCMAKTGLAESWGLVKGYKKLWPAPSVRYIMSWYKDHRLEMLAKANIPNLAKYYIYHPDDLSEGNTLYEMLRVTKPVFKFIQRENMDYSTTYQFQRLYKAEQSMTLEKYRRIKDLELDISRLLYVRASYNLTFDKILAYLDSVYDHQCIVRNNALTEWCDYLNMAKRLSMDLTQKSLLFPTSLKKEHDIAIFAYNALKQEVDAKQFAKTAEENKAKYEYAYGELMAIIPQTPEDIIEEATKQHNCLRSYIERVRDGATVVAFIRRKNAPKESYISVEIFEGALSQVKLAYNQDPHSDELDEFLNHWCKARNIKRNPYSFF